jgi:hypothetical protein
VRQGRTSYDRPHTEKPGDSPMRAVFELGKTVFAKGAELIAQLR